MSGSIHPQKLAHLTLREAERFAQRTAGSADLQQRARRVMPDGVPMPWMVGLYHHPTLFVTGGQGSRFHDVDGNAYSDFNLADLSNTVGYGVTAVSNRIAAQAARGTQFLLPTDDALAVAGALGDRTGMPMWQFTVSASSANTEVIRVARAMTGRSKVVVFEGKYHGHIDTTMVEHGAPDGLGLLPKAAQDTIDVPFNDLPALERALSGGDVALVLTEPALTNCTLVLPDTGFMAAACAMTRANGALFCLDETHTWQMAWGGLKQAWGLEADFVVLGKGLGSGMPLGAWGMDGRTARYVADNRQYAVDDRPGLALGGTLHGGALPMAAARAMLEEVATKAAYARIAALGQRLSDGIDGLIAAHSLPWRAFRLGPRSGFCLSPNAPRNLHEVEAAVDMPLIAARRLFMANRGVWDAIYSAGAQVSFAHEAEDIDLYLNVAATFLDEVVAA